MLPLAVLLGTTVAGPVLAAPIRGEASWYGEFHRGRPMANGRPFRMMQATVAHRTLPLGTVVEVRNLDNGRTATAEVTDRGPYVRGRVLDVSKGVAQSLDMLDTGTARIEIRVLWSQG
jgi:rare lipoprotein A